MSTNNSDSASENDELINEFLVESYENLDRLDRELVQLERDPHAKESLASIFRTIHTIKGTCGFLGFAKLESVAHVGESLLSLLRDGEMTMNSAIADGLLKMVDAIRQMLSAVESTGKEGDGDYTDVIRHIEDLRAGETTNAEAIADSPPAVVSAPAPIHATTAAMPAPVMNATTVTSFAPEAAEARSSTVSEAHLRVDVGVLDKLMNLVGELVLARNQILQYSPPLEDQAFTASKQRLDLITTELQSGVMKTRMQPIGNVWDKFPRVVRDLAAACGKQVRIDMEGQETELDKTIIEAIKDPLTHLVRNCVDHGIEGPSERVVAGKSAEGCLRLRAFHEGGQVNIEISDDGAGLNVERIRHKAVERALVTAEQATRMSERELQALIFLPGFSTAARISHVSGRGVGMDVVKTNIEKIGGTVDLHSRQGHGTTFRIKIPLTLAIIPALVVSSAGDRYAIPQISLLELVRIEPGSAIGIELVHGTPVYRLRGNLLPLVHLDRELGLSSDKAGTGDGHAVNIVVVQADERRFGLVVDRINDTEEIVVKPLGQHLKGLTAFAGATIMGDGRVALILDIMGLAQRSSVVSEGQIRAVAKAQESTANASRQMAVMLLFVSGDGRRMAIPLSQVARLETFPRTCIESLCGRKVVQHRGEILPLVEIGGAASACVDDQTPLHVVVHTRGGRSVGLLVGQIVDIVEHSTTALDHETGQPSRSAVIQEKVTELIDVPTLLSLAALDQFSFAEDMPS